MAVVKFRADEANSRVRPQDKGVLGRCKFGVRRRTLRFQYSIQWEVLGNGSPLRGWFFAILDLLVLSVGILNKKTSHLKETGSLRVSQ